jgi:hypothetical protein
MKWFISIDPGIKQVGYAVGFVGFNLTTGENKARVTAAGCLSIAEDEQKGARWDPDKLVARVDEVVAKLPDGVDKSSCICLLENQYAANKRVTQVFGGLRHHLEAGHGFRVKSVSASHKATHFGFKRGNYYQRKKESLRCAREWIAAQEPGDLPAEVADAFRKGGKGQANGRDSELFDQADALMQAVALVEKTPKTSLERQRKCRAGQRDRKAKAKAEAAEKQRAAPIPTPVSPVVAVVDLTGDGAAPAAPRRGSGAVVVDLT